jgi:hypothetical protein
MHGISAALDTEWSLLRAACSTDSSQAELERPLSLLREPPRWKALFDLADRHGTQPLLYKALSKVKDAVPPEQMRTLEQRYQINLHKALFLSRELIRILDHLSGMGIEVMPYKGLPLAEAIYGDIALRQSGDIDMLVRPADLWRIKQALGELGYAPHSPLSEAEEQEYLKSGYECAFDGPAGRNLLEVQWAIQPRFYAVDFDMDGLFRRAVALTVAGHPMKTPSPEDLFLVLSLHAAKHVWGRLIWLCDLARIMKFPGLNWNWIASQATDLGAVRIIRISLLLANELLETPIPAAADASLPKDRHAVALAKEIQSHIASDAAYNVESLAYFRLMLRLRERQADRLRIVNRLAFTPGPGEWAVVRLPRSLFPLYRIVRLSRLAARLVSS